MLHMAKTNIELVACEETYNSLVTFKSVDELNEAVRVYRDEIKKLDIRGDMKQNLSKLIMIIKEHSCKYFGVSFLTKRSMSKILEVSYKTIQRLMIRLRDLGMVKEYDMKRPSDMRQTSNIVTIQPIVKEEESNKEPAKTPVKCPTKKTTTQDLKTNTFKTYKQRNNNISTEDTLNNLKSAEFVAHWVNPRFTNLANSYFSKAKTIEELWRVVLQNNTTAAFNKEQEAHIGYIALKELVMKMKSGTRFTKSIFAYFHGVVDKLMGKFYFDKKFMDEENLEF